MLRTAQARALAAAIVFATMGTLLALAPQRSVQADTAAMNVQSERFADARTATQPDEPAVAQTTTRQRPVTTVARGDAPKRALPASDTAPLPSSNVWAYSAEPAAVASRPDVALVSSTTAAPAQQSNTITITGCLARDDDEFKLEDTEGEDAPRSRSWATGFLRQRNRSVDVVDSQNRFRLSDRVGERVIATGMLVNGSLELGTLRRVAATCETEG